MLASADLADWVYLKEVPKNSTAAADKFAVRDSAPSTSGINHNLSFQVSELWRRTIVNPIAGQAGPSDTFERTTSSLRRLSNEEFSRVLTEELLERVARPGQYLGNEWGARRKCFDRADVRLALAFPDLYELGMSNFGLKILYQIVNDTDAFMCDRSYAPADDMEALLRERALPLWAWESRRALSEFELLGFSLQYELTYTNVLNMLELAGLPVLSEQRANLFPLVFGGGPSSVNPEPMARFMDFFLIGDGEVSLPAVMEIVRQFKAREHDGASGASLRQELLFELATNVPGVYVPALYSTDRGVTPTRTDDRLPERVFRQSVPLSDSNQPTNSIVPYLSLVHDREVLEVRRGCDRGCRFCQPGYTFLPVRERSTDDLLRLSRQAMSNSGHQEYSMLSLCVSDYTSLHESVRALNEEHSRRRSSLSFPSQRADRMNLDIAEELKAVRKSGITLAPEAGSERLRAIINKGLSHQQIISAIESAYQSGWTAVKLYFMCGLPMEEDEDLAGIIEILKEANAHCRRIRKADPVKYKKDIEFTCTISNFVPKPFTPFQWFGQITPEETVRRHKVLKEKLRESGLKRGVQLNLTGPETSLMEAVISRGDRRIGDLIYETWKAGARFDAWEDKFKSELWHETAARLGISLHDRACAHREVGSRQPWDVVHVGLNDWWLVKEWEKAKAAVETAPCTENLCHACGVCTELETTHLLAQPKVEVMRRNPFVKELAANNDDDHHPSLFFTKPDAPLPEAPVTYIRFELQKRGDLRFIGHLDLQHLIARAARRAGIDISFSQGFNPSPRLVLAAPLPLFQESVGEIGEIALAVDMSAEQFRTGINAKLPPEIQVTRARTIGKAAAALATLVVSAKYRAFPAPAASGQAGLPDLSQLSGKVAELLAKDELLAEEGATTNGATGGSQLKETKRKNIRPGILSIKVIEEPTTGLEFELATGPALHTKPSDLLAHINANVSWRITRLELFAESGSPLYEVYNEKELPMHTPTTQHHSASAADTSHQKV